MPFNRGCGPSFFVHPTLIMKAFARALARALSLFLSDGTRCCAEVVCAEVVLTVLGA